MNNTYQISDFEGRYKLMILFCRFLGDIEVIAESNGEGGGKK